MFWLNSKDKLYNGGMSLEKTRRDVNRQVLRGREEAKGYQKVLAEVDLEGHAASWWLRSGQPGKT